MDQHDIKPGAGHKDLPSICRVVAQGRFALVVSQAPHHPHHHRLCSAQLRCVIYFGKEAHVSFSTAAKTRWPCLPPGCPNSRSVMSPLALCSWTISHFFQDVLKEESSKGEGRIHKGCGWWKKKDIGSVMRSTRMAESSTGELQW